MTDNHTVLAGTTSAVLQQWALGEQCADFSLMDFRSSWTFCGFRRLAHLAFGCVR